MREFSRKKAHREHMVRNLATSLILYEKIETTKAKGDETKDTVEKLIARSISGDLNSIRRLQGFLFDRLAVKKVIEELLPRYIGRKSGFITSYHLKNRPGDNSEMIRLELVDRKKFVGKEETKAVKEDKKSDTKETVEDNKK